MALDFNKLNRRVESIYTRGVQTSRTKGQLHTFLKKELRILAGEFSLAGEEEYPVVLENDGRRGLIDVVWKHGENLIVAIEIDSARRKKSIRKLLASRAQVLLWVYYGDKPYESILNENDPFNKIMILSLSQSSKSEMVGVERWRMEGRQWSSEGERKIGAKKKYSLLQIRKTYPRAYKPWSQREEDLLVKMFQAGMQIGKIAEKLGRNTGSIRARLRKLGFA